MEKNYYSRYKTGGSNLAKGIAYQDLVSLLYMFKYIEREPFKEITFETNDDFTIIMDTCEMYVQVKNTLLTTPQVREILESKSIYTKNKCIKQIIIASSYDQKFKSILKNLNYFRNLNRTHQSEQEKQENEDELNQQLKKDGINHIILKETEFEEIPDSQIIEVVKLYIYRWSEARNLEIEIDDLFNKLITLIALHLRPDRSSLNRKEIEELALSCPRKKSNKHVIPQNSIHFDNSKESILLALRKDIVEKKHFSDKLTLVKLYIETEDLDTAREIANEIYNYEESFMYYYLWLLYHSGNMNKLMKKCNNLIKEGSCLYYSHYFKGLLFMEKKDYSRAIASLVKAQLNDRTFEISLILAKLYSLVGDEDASLSQYNFCLTKQPMDPDVLVGISPLVPKHEAIVYLDQVIEKNPTYYRAYFEKGKILRYYGLNKDAYDYFRKYLDYNDVYDKEVFKETSLCLLSMGDEKAFNYLNNWLSDLLFNEYDDKLLNGETILILNETWNTTDIISCTKSGEDYVVRTSIREYLIIKGENSQIFIGCVVDSFLRMTSKFFKEHNNPLEIGDEYIPSIIKLYHSKNEFDKVIKSKSLHENAFLNKDYPFYNEMCRSNWHFKEYIMKNEAIQVLIEELQNAIHVQVKIGGSFITGWFKREGKNYFKFCTKVEKPTAFNEAVLILECGESKEKIDIKFNVSVIKITKNATYPRETYANDIILPV